MFTKMDKAIVGLIITAIAYLLAQYRIELPADVSQALEMVLNWLIPVLLALAGGFLVWLTPNRK